MEATITKLTPEIMAEIEEMRVKLTELRKIGIYSIDTHYPEVHITNKLFEANFPNIEAVASGAPTYPYKKSVLVDGVEYLALYKEV